MNHFYAGAIASLAIIGIIHFGNHLNDRLPTVHAPLVQDMRQYIVTNGMANYKGTNWPEFSNMLWQIMTTNGPTQ